MFGLLALVACSTAGRHLRDRPAIIVLPAATNVQVADIYDGQVSYRLREPYPADRAIREMQTRLRQLGWRPRQRDFLNPQGSGATRGEWTELEIEARWVRAWSQQWENDSGDVVQYGLIYRPRPRDQTSASLEVLISYFKGDAVRAIESEMRQPALIDGQVPGDAERTVRRHDGGVWCSVSTTDAAWQDDGGSAIVSVKFGFSTPAAIRALPSMRLVALPAKPGLERAEYWAPFDVADGRTTTKSQTFDPRSETIRQPLQLVPSKLLWAPTKSSVWPSQGFARTVPAGRYGLRIQLELDNGVTVSSNEIEITVKERAGHK